MHYYTAQATYKGIIFSALGLTRYYAKKELKEILWNQGARDCDAITINSFYKLGQLLEL